MSTEENEKLLTHSEVRQILEAAMERPKAIYTGPEEVGPAPPVEEPTEENPEVVPDPAASLGFEKKATREHVNNFIRIDADKAKKMIDELMKFERMTDLHAFKIAEIMPRDEQELRPVFAKERYTIEPEELKKMLEVIDRYRA